MKKNKTGVSTGVGVTGLLQVAFIVLRLCGVINWSWWWVMAPSWITAAIVVLTVIAFIIFEILDL